MNLTNNQVLSVYRRYTDKNPKNFLKVDKSCFLFYTVNSHARQSEIPNTE